MGMGVVGRRWSLPMNRTKTVILVSLAALAAAGVSACKPAASNTADNTADNSAPADNSTPATNDMNSMPAGDMNSMNSAAPTNSPS
jgi:hypothetical protein